MINLVSAGSQKQAQRGGGESKEKLFSGPVQLESKELLHIKYSEASWVPALGGVRGVLRFYYGLIIPKDPT